MFIRVTFALHFATKQQKKVFFVNVDIDGRLGIELVNGFDSIVIDY